MSNEELLENILMSANIADISVDKLEIEIMDMKMRGFCDIEIIKHYQIVEVE